MVGDDDPEGECSYRRSSPHPVDDAAEPRFEQVEVEHDRRFVLRVGDQVNPNRRDLRMQEPVGYVRAELLSMHTC